MKRRILSGSAVMGLLLAALLTLIPYTYAEPNSPLACHPCSKTACVQKGFSDRLVVGKESGSGRLAFDPEINKVAVLAPNALGLPGEPITWVITVINHGAVAGTNLTITDAIPAALRVDSVEADRGFFSINGQTVVFTLPELEPGAAVQMRINTTVLRAQGDGRLLNQAVLNGSGPDGPVTLRAEAELFVPTGLPATGYKHEELPGEGEPSVYVIGLASFAAVALAAWVVWRRGKLLRAKV